MNVPNIVLHSSASAQLDVFLSHPSHALLLTGPGGCGKTHIATALAGRLLDVPEQQMQTKCCVIKPQKASISIQDIRTLIGFFQLTVPGKARIKRVAIIQDADTMGTEAQNALLKLLEEPPADSVIILTSSQPQGLLSTIRSRTQLLQLASPEKQALTEHFTALGHNTEAVARALLRGGGRVTEAARLLSDGASATDTVMELVKQALGSNVYDRLLLVDGLAKQKDAALDFVDTLLTVATAGLEASAQKGLPSIDRWQSVLRAAHTAEDALNHSGNTKLVLTELMLAV